MKTRGPVLRIKWDYFQNVKIPDDFKIYLWDYKEKASLEILILRVLNYGNFKEIRKVYNMYPSETEKIAFKYPNIKRGIKFWIKVWRNL